MSPIAATLLTVTEKASDVLVLTSAKVALTIALSFLVLLAMRRTTASLRHWILVLTLGAALAMPLLELMLPSWRLIPIQAGSNASLSRLAPSSAEALSASGVEESRTDLESPATSINLDAAPARRVRWRALVGVLWLIGVAIASANLCLRMVVLSRAVRRAKPCNEPRWNALVGDTCKELGVTREVRPLLRAAGAMPAVWGLRRPVILLPQDCLSWSQERRRAVLHHELAHVVRQDILVSILTRAVGALYWFHPMMWALQRRLAVEREQACDDIALGLGIGNHSYAEELLEIASQYSSSASTTLRARHSLAPVMAGSSQLEERIMAILETDRNRRRQSARSLIATAALALAFLVPLSSLTWAQKPAFPDNHKDAAVPVQYESHSDQFGVHLERLGIDTGDTDRLIWALGDALELTRAAAAWALGASADSSAIAPLIRATEDPAAIVREWAVRSLGNYDDPRIVEALLFRLDDDSTDVREWTVRSIAVSDDPRVVDGLTLRFDDEAAAVREWAVRQLSQVDDPRVQDALRDSVYRETNDDVREWAIRSLKADGDPRSVDALVQALGSPSSDVREWAVRGLGGSRSERAVVPLIDMLDDPSNEVREWAVRGLGDSGDPRAIGPLQSRLGDDDSEVREWAERVLEALEG